MSEKTLQFSGIIKASNRGGAYVDFPFDVEKEFGKKRVKIQATFDGEIYRGTLTRYGSPEYFLLIRKVIRKKIGKQVGDFIEVTVKEDTAPRVVEVPDDFKAVLKNHPEQELFFNQLSYTHRKEYINWIVGAKRAETRIRRMHKAIEMMKDGKKGK